MKTSAGYGQTIARSGLAVSAAKSIRYGLLFLVQAFLMNLMAPDDFGLMKYVTILLGIINLITVAGINTAVIQKKELHDNEHGSLFILNLSICLVLFALTFTVAPAVARFFGEPELITLMRVGALVIPVGGCSTIHRSLLQREFRYGTLSVIEAVSAAVSSAVSIILAFKGYGAWALCWSLITFHFFSSAMCVFARRLNRWKFTMRELAVALPLFWLSAGWMLQRLLEYLNANLGNILIGRFFGAGALGAFTVASEMVFIPQFGFGLVLAPIILSAFSRMQDDDGRIKDAYFKIVLFTSMAAAIHSVVIGLCASDLIKTITMLKPGDAWNDTAFFLRRLAPVGLLLSWCSCSGVLWIVKQKIALQIYWAVAMILTTAAAIIIGANYGYAGICAALLIRAAVTFPILLYILKKVSHIPPLGYLGAILPSLICGGTAAAACAAAKYLLTVQFPTHHAIRLAVCAALSVAVFLTVAVLLYGKSLKALRGYFVKHGG